MSCFINFDNSIHSDWIVTKVKFFSPKARPILHCQLPLQAIVLRCSTAPALLSAEGRRKKKCPGKQQIVCSWLWLFTFYSKQQPRVTVIICSSPQQAPCWCGKACRVVSVRFVGLWPFPSLAGLYIVADRHFVALLLRTLHHGSG